MKSKSEILKAIEERLKGHDFTGEVMDDRFCDHVQPEAWAYLTEEETEALRKMEAEGDEQAMFEAMSVIVMAFVSWLHRGWVSGEEEKPQEVPMRKEVVELAQGALDKIRRVIVEGLPPVYKGVNDWLMDFYPDLPWNLPEQAQALEWIMARPEFEKVAQDFRAKFDFDLKREFQKVVS
jgi:hypothetical protein